MHLDRSMRPSINHRTTSPFTLSTNTTRKQIRTASTSLLTAAAKILGQRTRNQCRLIFDVRKKRATTQNILYREWMQQVFLYPFAIGDDTKHTVLRVDTTSFFWYPFAIGDDPKYTASRMDTSEETCAKKDRDAGCELTEDPRCFARGWPRTNHRKKRKKKEEKWAILALFRKKNTFRT